MACDICMNVGSLSLVNQSLGHIIEKLTTQSPGAEKRQENIVRTEKEVTIRIGGTERTKRWMGLGTCREGK